MGGGKLFLIWSDQIGLFTSLRSLLGELGWQSETIYTVKTLEEFRVRDKLICLALLNPWSHVFSTIELEQLTQFFLRGNHLIVASGENEDGTYGGNLNSLVAKFGVTFNQDCVIRPNPYKYYYPKEAQLEDFIVNRGLGDSLRKYIKLDKNPGSNDEIVSGTRIIYPRGCTLKVDKRSTIMMTSSKWAIPTEQAICSFHRDPSNRSRMIAIGSAWLMSDQYLNKEANAELVKTFLDFIIDRDFHINISDARTIEIPESIYTPDINELVDVPIPCLQESEPLPVDKTSLIDKRLFSVDNSMLPTIIKAFHDLHVSHERLTLIKPDFNCESLSLEPADHGFLLRKLK